MPRKRELTLDTFDAADKAATSPSLDLSAAMQSATWEVDDLGDFRVKIDLKEERFGKGETEIRWNSRERWENQVRNFHGLEEGDRR